MARIPLLGLGQLGKSPAVTAKRMQNFYAEIRPQGEKSIIVAYGIAGLSTFVNFGDTPIRGGLYFSPNDVSYVVHRGTLYEVNNAGVATSKGSLSTTENRVSMDHNGTQVMIVDGTYGYTYNTATGVFAKITDADFGANPTTVTFQDGYFIVTFAQTGQFQLSDSYDGTSWNALMVSNADSNPDDLVRVISDHGQLILMGTLTTEFWQDNGATSFPYSRIPGTTNEWGLAARWSLAKFNDSLIGLVKSALGSPVVAVLNGFTWQTVSTPDVNAVFQNAIDSGLSLGDASGFSYMENGHALYQINFNAAGFSYLYDSSTGMWSPLKSYGIARHRLEFGWNFLGSTIAASYSTGKLYRIKGNVYDEDGDMIEGEIVSENIMMPDGDRFIVDKIRLDMQTGVGLATGQGSDPQISLQVSEDGGQSWSKEMLASMGKAGDTLARAEWVALGQFQQFNAKFRITDPVKRVIVSASINPDD